MNFLVRLQVLKEDPTFRKESDMTMQCADRDIERVRTLRRVLDLDQSVTGVKLVDRLKRFIARVRDSYGDEYVNAGGLPAALELTQLMTDQANGPFPCLELWFTPAERLPQQGEEVIILLRGRRQTATLKWDITSSASSLAPDPYWHNEYLSSLRWEDVSHWTHLNTPELPPQEPKHC